MSRPKHVPRAQDGNVHPTRQQGLLALGTHRDVALHHGRGMRNAQVDKMLNAGFARGFHGSQSGRAINRLELRRLGWAGMRYADQLYESLAWRYQASVSRRLECIARYRLATGRQLLLASRTHQRSHVMSTRDQLLDHRPADVSGAAGDED